MLVAILSIKWLLYTILHNPAGICRIPPLGRNCNALVRCLKAEGFNTSKSVNLRCSSSFPRSCFRVDWSQWVTATQLHILSERNFIFTRAVAWCLYMLLLLLFSCFFFIREVVYQNNTKMPHIFYFFPQKQVL